MICDTPRGLQPWQPACGPCSYRKERRTRDTEAKAAALDLLRKSDLNLGSRTQHIYEAYSQRNEGHSIKLTNKQMVMHQLRTEHQLITEPKAIEDIIDQLPISKINCFSCGIDCTRVHWHNSHSGQDAFSRSKQAQV